jgi:hypothetical protein
LRNTGIDELHPSSLPSGFTLPPPCVYQDMRAVPGEIQTSKFFPLPRCNNCSVLHCSATAFLLFLLSFSITVTPRRYFAFCPHRVLIRTGYSSLSGQHKRAFIINHYLHMYTTCFGRAKAIIGHVLVLSNSPTRARAPSCSRFLDHTQLHNTVGRTPLDEGSARRRDLGLTTHTTHKTQTSVPPAGFEPAISASERS